MPIAHAVSVIRNKLVSFIARYLCPGVLTISNLSLIGVGRAVKQRKKKGLSSCQSIRPVSIHLQDRPENRVVQKLAGKKGVAGGQGMAGIAVQRARQGIGNRVWDLLFL